MTEEILQGGSYTSKQIEQIAAAIEARDAIVKPQALENLFMFNRYVLGVEEGRDKLAQVHRDICRFAEEDRKKKKLLLIPRGHLKSTLITIGYATQQIVKNPNIRILILNAVWQLAVDFLTEIKRNLTSAPELVRLYGSLADQPEEWAADRILIRRPGIGIKGPTVWAAGVDSNLTGSHPDLILMDDVVSRDNTQTIDQIEKVKLRYKDALDLLEPGGQLIVIGTRWTYNDFYSWILDKDNPVNQNYQTMLKRAYIGDLDSGLGFQALWPEKFTREELLARKNEKGWYEFSAQYMNDPVAQGDADFSRENFQYYDLEEYRSAKMNTVMAIDPAIGEKKRNDYTAIGVFAADQFSNFFVKDLERGHWKVGQIVDAIFIMAEMWHPSAIILETVAYQKALAYVLQLEMQKRGRFLPIIEKQYHDKTKEERIKQLQPLYANKKVFHRPAKNVKLMPYFEEELLQFPRGAHDDMIDTFAMALDILVPPKQNSNRQRYQRHYLYG